MSRSVRVNHSTYDLLKKIRDGYGLRSMDQAVEYVIKQAKAEKSMTQPHHPEDVPEDA